MYLYIKCIIITFIIFKFPVNAFADHCYHCDSTENIDCVNDFKSNDTFKIDCNAVKPLRILQEIFPKLTIISHGCMKMDLTFGRDYKVVVRTCNWADEDESSFYWLIGKGFFTSMIPIFIQRHPCNDDFCNSSTVTGPVAVTVALLIVLAHMMS